MRDFVCRFFNPQGDIQEQRVLMSGNVGHATASARVSARSLHAAIFEVLLEDRVVHREQLAEWPGAVPVPASEIHLRPGR